jgi:hypothetical protein
MGLNYAEAYSELHKNQKWFAGYTLKRYADEIAKLVIEQQSRSLADYGCGKGYQYLEKRLHEKWGGLLPYCYDVGVRQLASRDPEKRPWPGNFDGIICTDVLEHIEQQDIPGLLDDALSMLTQEDRPVFAYFSAATIASERKNLPDGRNVHVTLKPAEWWDAQWKAAFARLPGRPQLVMQTRCDGETTTRFSYRRQV